MMTAQTMQDIRESAHLLAEMLRCLYEVRDRETVQGRMDGLELRGWVLVDPFDAEEVMDISGLSDSALIDLYISWDKSRRQLVSNGEPGLD